MELLWLTISTIGFIILYKISVIIHAHYVTRKKLRNIPGPTSYPFIGTPQLMTMKAEDRIPWYLSLANKFKDGIFILWVGWQPIVVVCKPELINVILSSNTHINKAYFYDFLKEWLGDGLITASGKQWHKDRKLISPTFHFDILEQFAVTISEQTEIMIKRLEKTISDNSAKVINIIPFIHRVTFDIIQETAMGINADENSTYQKTLIRYLQLFVYRTSRWWLWTDWIYYLLPSGRECRLHVNTMHTTTNEIIQKKKLARNMQDKKLQNEKDELDVPDMPKRKVFLDLLLNINEKENAPLTDEQLRAQVHTFLFAGQDTVSNSVNWALFCIGNDLMYQEKIHEELKEIFKDSQRPATTKELLQLKYLERAIKEARRLYATVPIISRKLMEDIKLDDHVIPKGAIINIPILLVHRNSTIWANPLNYDPDRFLPENMKRMHPYAYIPFSAGPRNCIGQKFAMLEEKTLLTAILRKWRVKSVQKHEDISLMLNVVLRSKEDDISLHFIPKI